MQPRIEADSVHFRLAHFEVVHYRPARILFLCLSSGVLLAGGVAIFTALDRLAQTVWVRPADKAHKLANPLSGW